MDTVNLDRKYDDKKLFINVWITETTLIAERVLFHLFQFKADDQEHSKTFE